MDYLITIVDGILKKMSKEIFKVFFFEKNIRRLPSETRFMEMFMPYEVVTSQKKSPDFFFRQCRVVLTLEKITQID